MSYQELNDPNINDPHAFVSASVSIRFCNMGFVTSKKWSSAYMTILDGIVKFYDSEESCQSNPLSHFLLITLGSKHQASEVKRKNYQSQDKRSVIEFFTFYIQIDNGIFLPTRLIKIGSPIPSIIEKIVKCIDVSVDS
mmetsp:Transcript_7790/g.6963  ORF Transcript_7790/g.6963 Transcript_7790/m.6963 type:complete len:138 (+) Transcript_7790:87-500(+)